MDNEGQVKVKKSIWKRWWFWLVVVVIVIGIVGAATGGNQEEKDSVQTSSVSTGDNDADTEKEESAEEAIKVTAQELLEAYDENGVAADKQYKGKELQVTGTVGSIGTDIIDDAYITLENEEEEYAVISVQCYFEKSEEESIASLKAGDKVTVTGVCEGNTLNVVLKKCQVVS